MQCTRPALETPSQAMHSTDFGMQFRFSLLDQPLWRSCSIVPSIPIQYSIVDLSSLLETQGATGSSDDAFESFPT